MDRRTCFFPARILTLLSLPALLAQTGCHQSLPQGKPALLTLPAEVAPPPVAAADEAAPAAGPKQEAAKQETPAPQEGLKKKEEDPSVGGIPGNPAGGVIAGRVVLLGKPEELKPLEVPADNRDRTVCGHEIINERLIVGPRNEVLNAVASLTKVEGAPKARKRSLILDNVHCRFVPHVLAGTVGSTIKITTQDVGVLHSAMALLTESWNVSVSSPDQPVQRTLNRPGWVPIKCAVHGWMQAHLWVFPHDFFAVTGKEGTFRIEGIPPGTYELVVWQEALQKSQTQVTVEAGKTAEVAVELKPHPKR